MDLGCDSSASCRDLSDALRFNQSVTTVDLSGNPKLDMDVDGPGLISVVQELSSRVVEVKVHGTHMRAPTMRQRVYQDAGPDYVPETVCDKSSFEDELKRSIIIRRVRTGDTMRQPSITCIEWAGQGLGDNDGLERPGDPSQNLLKALKEDRGYVRYVDVSNNPKVTSRITKKLEELGLPGQLPLHTNGCTRKIYLDPTKRTTSY